ncbi:MAG: hypothetical protein QN139_05550, partial [Armatimonadota bacterium]|nr:hypothetical protein [Armatimonadota bacterium]
HSPLATYLLEAGTLLVGLVLYLRATVPRDRVGALALWGVVLVLAAAYLAGVLGPPPASVQGVAVTALVGGWALVAWAYWIDRHRRAAS